MILKAAVITFILLIAFLHVLAAMFSLHDRDMRQFAAHSFTNATGDTIHYYDLQVTNAEWNIVFIHGTPATAAVFGEQFRRPFPQANLFAMDRPGFGASGPGPRRPSLEYQAEAVESLLSRLPNGKTILVGHSYGAPVAMATALKYPDQIKGLLLIGGSVDPAQEHVYIVQKIADWPIFSWLMPKPLRQCNRELLTLRGDLLPLQKQLPDLQVSVVMLHGTKDRQVPIANVDYLRTQLAPVGKSDLFDSLVISNYNHFIPWEHPAAVEQALGKLTNHIRSREIR